MTTPTVTETCIPLQAVTRDDFADSLPSPRQLNAHQAPTHRRLDSAQGRDDPHAA
jgi:hypothetical protein